MHKKTGLSALISLFLVFGVCLNIWGEEPVEFAAGEILLKFRQGTSQNERTAFEKEFDLTLLRESKATGVLLYLSKQDNVLPIIEKISKSQRVEFVEPNYVQKKRSVPNDPLSKQTLSFPTLGYHTTILQSILSCHHLSN